ncbi:hypothetical protein [Pseudomonas tohonis]|uniref:hypothetical protein n=1 Tax=Pseudomonas tohonis TaxID=2725477 RepID=UPI00255B7984|nr:hypothetical protein [Pseudomonas tohonis]
MTSKTKGPARTPAKCSLQAWFARSAPVAVLLRRGPSDWVRMIRWDLRDDSFEPGQWFHGAIATEQCDLSEDGELFLYLARREGRRYWPEDYGPVWTAVSRPPHFTALALWTHSGYEGGGVFKDVRQVTLNIAQPRERRAGSELPLLVESSGRSSSWAQACLRRGWQAPDRPDGAEANHNWQAQTRLTKKQSELMLVWQKHRAPRYQWRNHFTLWRNGEPTALGDADFVDFDSSGRLLMGRKGQVLVCPRPIESLEWTQLADFSGEHPEPVQPTEIAMTWPDSQARTTDRNTEP